jgi:hypothetical protein
LLKFSQLKMKRKIILLFSVLNVLIKWIQHNIEFLNCVIQSKRRCLNLAEINLQKYKIIWPLSQGQQRLSIVCKISNKLTPPILQIRHLYIFKRIKNFKYFFNLTGWRLLAILI